MSEVDPMLWAAKMQDEHAWVIHVPTHTIQRVKQFYQAHEFISPVNKLAVKDPVIELDDGNNFLAIEENFVPLTQNEAGFFVFAQGELKDLLTTWVQKAAKASILPETIGILISATLRAQLMALMQTRQRLSGGQQPPPPPTA
jgi:hypothetical protein